MDKVLDGKDIFRVTDDLGARGARCTVNVRGVVDGDGSVGYVLDSIKARFPTGRRWDIMDIEFEESEEEG